MSSFILSLHNILTLPLAVIGPTVLILLMLAASIAASVKQRSGVILSVCLSVSPFCNFNAVVYSQRAFRSFCPPPVLTSALYETRSF